MANYTEIAQIIIPSLTITHNYVSTITLNNPTNLTATIDRPKISFTAFDTRQKIFFTLTKDILLPAMIVEVVTENLSVDIMSPNRFLYLSQLLTCPSTICKEEQIKRKSINRCTNTNLIINGDFQNGVIGWATSFIDYYSFDGINWWIDLNSCSPGAIEQIIPTTIGAEYNVFYSLAGNSASKTAPIRTGTISVRPNGSIVPTKSENFQFDVTNIKYSNVDLDMGWVDKSFTFTAGSTSTILKFASTSSSAGCFGPVIDNVSVCL